MRVQSTGKVASQQAGAVAATWLVCCAEFQLTIGDDGMEYVEYDKQGKVRRRQRQGDALKQWVDEVGARAGRMCRVWGGVGAHLLLLLSSVCLHAYRCRPPAYCWCMLAC
jgi:hypothetical protein